MYDGDLCGDIHEIMRENATRETLKLSGEVVAFHFTNRPYDARAERDIVSAYVAVRARGMGR